MFDELDKMPFGVLDGIKAYLDYIEKVDNVDFRLVMNFHRSYFLHRSTLILFALGELFLFF